MYQTKLILIVGRNRLECINWCVKNGVNFGESACERHPLDYEEFIKNIESNGYTHLITQHPYVIDFSPENQVVCVKGNKSKLLSEHPHINSYKGCLSSGEFWILVAEEDDNWIDKE